MTEETLRARATNELESLSKHSKLFDNGTEKDIATFNMTECSFGALLGRGGFSCVHEVDDIRLTPELNSSATRRGSTTNVVLPKFSNSRNIGDKKEERDPFLANAEARRFIASTTKRSGLARYAVKRLSSKTISKAGSPRPRDNEMFVAGVVDLAMETKFLAVLQHPHIIKIRGVSSAHPCSDLYFLVLDRLYDTLTERLQVWKGDKKKLSGMMSLVDMRREERKRELHLERLCAAYGICSAMVYLHNNKIVYRDLKPDNIGFDIRDVVKIFDFGLAREIDQNEKMGDKLFVMSGDTGSLRYMAPENALHKPYNQKVDVYSFGLILWQMLRLETPFTDIKGVNDFRSRVIENGERPYIGSEKKVESWASPALKALFRKCWSTVISIRPNFNEILDILRQEIDDTELVDSLDSSTRTQESIANRANGISKTPKNVKKERRFSLS